MKSPPQPTDRKAVDALQSERSRMQAEVGNVIAGAHRTLAQSRALLAEVDAFLAREKTPPSTPRALIAKGHRGSTHVATHYSTHVSTHDSTRLSPSALRAVAARAASPSLSPHFNRFSAVPWTAR